jgi:hypothetical protein
MKLTPTFFSSLFLITASFTQAQEITKTTKTGERNPDKFKQMYDLFATPNMYRTASGAPGPEYYQQQADYKIDVELDDKNQKLYGTETITYTNNAKESLDYLWVQLDQNEKARNSNSPLVESNKLDPAFSGQSFSRKYLEEDFDGGFKIEYVKDSKGNTMQYTVNQTMMRIELPNVLKFGEKISFSIKWWYNINNYTIDGGRSGYEHFEKDGNNLYVIAQFYPRMAVYNDVEGWQNMQFWGRGEFALTFGDYEVNITVPADHIMEGTGVIQNKSEVYSAEQMKRWALAETTFDKPVVIVTQEEAIQAEKGFSEQKVENDIKLWSQDPLSFLYYVRAANLPQIKGESVRIQAIIDGKPWETVMTFDRRESISVGSRNFEANVYRAENFQNGELKNKDNTFWISNDQSRYLLRVEAKLKVGSFAVALDRIL